MNGIWIRSQDGNCLYLCTSFGITTPSKDKKLRYIESGVSWLGTYPTEARALEVLDEIQRCLEEAIQGVRNYDSFVPGIYQMPKE